MINCDKTIIDWIIGERIKSIKIATTKEKIKRRKEENKREIVDF